MADEETLSIPKNRFQVFLEKIKNKALEIWNDKSHLFWYVLFLFLVAIAFFFIVLIENSFTLPLSGDYCLQQIPFYTNGYDDWWHFLKTGEFRLWDMNTFLGANNLGSNTFYYLLNPFFLPILLWPRDYIAQGLAVLMIVKMVLAGITFRLFLKYIGLKEKTARLFALAYAFCGWNVFYLWFNHFLEVCVVFPLVLMGIEKIIKEKRPWLLMGALGLMGLCNYFFLVSSCFCGVIYAGYRYFSSWKSKTPRDRLEILGIGFGAFAVGVLMGAITLYTAYPVIINSPRVEEANYFDKLLNAWRLNDFKSFFKLIFTFNSEKKAYYPLMSFLFPTISDYSSILFNNYGYDNTLCSLFIYTPLMMFFIPSLLQSIRKKRWHHLVATAFFLLVLFTPFFYYLCYGFTLDYGRWQIFVIAALLMFIAQNYEEREEMPRWFFDVSIGVLLIGVIIVVSYAFSIENDLYGHSVYPLGDRIYVVIGQVIYMIVCYFYLRFRHHEKDLTNFLMGVVAIEAVVMGTLTFNYQPPNDYSTVYGGLANVQEEERIIRAIQEQDPGFYRIFNTNADRHSNNLSMREGYNGVATFHSIYNYDLFDFINWSRISYSYKNWSMGVHEKRYNLDEFLNVKYYIQKTLQPATENSQIISNNIPLGFQEMPELSTANHKVYYNTNFIELGFAYDSLMLSEELIHYDNSHSNPYLDRNEIAYLTSAIVYPEDLEEIQSLLPNIGIKKYTSINNLSPVPTDGTLSYTREHEIYQGYYDTVKENNPQLSDDEIEEYIKEEYGFDYSLYKNDVTLVSDHYIPNFKYGTTIELTPRAGYTVCANAEDDPCYISLNLRMGENAMVRMFDKNDQEIVWDNHMWHYYNYDGDWKFNRGFYVDREVQRIKIIVYADSKGSGMEYPTIRVERYSEFQKRIENLKGENDANLFQNIKVTTNNIAFDTDYEQAKMIVLSVPYDDGWQGKYIDQDGKEEAIRIFKAQGGFLAFASKEGMTHYSLRYVTPNLKEAIAMCVSGIVIFAASWGAVYIVERQRKRRSASMEENHQDN